MLDEKAIVKEIATLFADRLLIEVDSPETDLLEAGAVDSVVLLELLLCVEQRFQVNLNIEEVETDDFRSLASIARLVTAHLPQTVR